MTLAAGLREATFVVPLAIAAIVSLASRKFAQRGSVRRWVFSLAWGVGFIAAYPLLFPVKDLFPRYHWHGLSAIVVVTAALGPLVASISRPAISRLIFDLLLAGGAAFLIVPKWPTLVPSRTAWIAILTVGFAALSTTMDAMTRRSPSRALGYVMAISAIAIAAVIAVTSSLTVGDLAAISALACLGAAIGLGRMATAESLNGAARLYSLATGAAAYIACVGSRPPLYPALLIPLTPLWLSLSARPDRRKRGLIAAAAYLTTVVAWCLV
jgi:hypothetical protein